MGGTTGLTTAPRGLPLRLHHAAHEVLRESAKSYAQEQRAAQALTGAKLDLLRHYDVPAMHRAVAICFWGRSGSQLLASYLDGHADLVLLPLNCGEAIYEFCEKFPQLNLWEKLIVYPTFLSSKKWGMNGALFAGDHAVAPAHYYAAVESLFAAYGEQPAAWLEQRQRFVQFLHVAHAVAAGRCPATPRPYIIYAQHWTDEERAQEFVADFPEARFLHTIRDPISTLDSWFDRQIDIQIARRDQGLDPAKKFFDPATETFRSLVRWDQPHAGMEERTRAVRFEDLHLAPAAVMQRVADWLGIPFRPTMLESTYNGAPFVWKNEGKSWVGANPANAERRSRNLSLLDRWLMFAVLRDNFLSWGYPMPRLFRGRLRAMLLSGLLLWPPMKMERTTARMLLSRQAWPAIRQGRLRFALGALVQLLTLRLRMMRMLAGETRARLIRHKDLLRPL
jgi:hypothetical protein